MNSGDKAESGPQSGLAWGEAPALDPFESIMWRLDVFPHLRSTVTSVELLDSTPEQDRVRDAHLRAVQEVRRLRERLVDPVLNFGLPEWREAADFSLDRHLEFLKLPAPGSLRQLLDVAQVFAMRPFDRGQPLWSALVVEGLDGGRAAYVLRLHHALSDGIGIVQLLSHLHSRGRSPSGRRALPVKTRAGRLPSRIAMTVRQFGKGLRQAPGDVRQTLSTLDELLKPQPGESRTSGAARYAASLRRVLAPAVIPPSPLLAARSHQWHFECLEFPLADFKAAAKSCGATLNDAFVSGLLGGLRRYHARFGSVPEEIPISFPISIRKAGDAAGGNRFAPGQLAGPLAETDPVQRMRQIGEQVGLIRSEPALAAPLALMPLLARLPTKLLAKAMADKLKSSDLQISNVPGLRDEMYFAGARITHQFPFAPLPGCPAMITLVSHGETCCVGLNLDRAAFAEPEQFMVDLRASFDEILELSKRPDTPPPKRAPAAARKRKASVKPPQQSDSR